MRLGGAYELFHLAEDSKDLRKTALDMLCLHIRQTTGENEYQKKHNSKPSEEIQSLLTLLFVQEHEVFKDLQINLQGSWLKGADLRKARLQGAILTGAHLQEANLSRAYLQGADLEDAQLQGANLYEAHLQGADLSLAQLQEANLRSAQLQEANLFCAHPQGADLSLAQLQGANLFWTHLQGVNLRSAQLQGANLCEAHLQGADLEDAQLQGANLLEAQLHETHLKETDLRGSKIKDRLRYLLISFEDSIRESIGKETDLSNAIFAGGLSREETDFLVKGLSDEKANKLRKRLEPHIKKKKRHKLPKKSGAITGAYTEEEAEEWIAEYEKAMSEVPEDDS